MQVKLELKDSEKLSSLFDKANKLLKELDDVKCQIDLILGCPNVTVSEITINQKESD